MGAITSIFDPEWLNSNGQRRYPLAEDASALDVTGVFALPDSFLVGLYVAIGAAQAVEPSLFFVRRVAVHSAGYSIELAYDDGTASPPIALGVVVSRAGHVENNQYALIGYGDFADAAGSVVVGNLAEIDAAGAGLYVFNSSGGRLDPDCVRPEIRGLAGLFITSGGTTLGPFYDDIELEAGSNVVFTVVSSVNGVTTIRLDAVSGAGLTASCACTGSPTLPPPIRTINGLPGDVDRNFAIVGSACLAIGTVSGGISLANPCSKPCCGCSELEAVTAEIAHVRDQADQLAAFAASIQSWTSATSATVLGTKLSDLPCS